ncbi:MAG: hypothetical protein WAV86_00750 [Lutibacter sp.]
MKILFPFKKELNPYLDEIINYSIHTYVYDNYINYNPSYDIVHIHWPEAIFEWEEPTSDELDDLERNINYWKQKSVIIYTKHDYQRNKGTTLNFTRLFELIEKNTDVFIHLGKFSQIFYQHKYPSVRHEIIYHPLYTKCFSPLDKEVARKNLQIAEDAFVIIVPGNVRNYAERDLMLNAFESINFNKKVLICINMYAELRYEFPGRTKLKSIIDIKKILINRFKQNHKPPEFLFTYGTQSNIELEIKMSVSDLVFIPRIHTLNSGMFFLGLTFNKIVVGPSIGNIEEQLIELELPAFNPKNKLSVSNALKKGMELSIDHKNYPDGLLKKYIPKAVAQQMDDLINDLC